MKPRRWPPSWAGAAVCPMQPSGHNAQDVDLVAIASLPDGVMVDPQRMGLPDGDTGRISLMEWLGG